MTERLDARAFNRATLARQFLLERTDASVHDAVGHLCGLQAQEPQEPFVGPWSRVSGFDPSELSRLLEQRAVVRLHLMRRTVHLATAEDARHLQLRDDPASTLHPGMDVRGPARAPDFQP
ncbi:DNA glycosylase AlkZ-like family protein [Dactylosporangium sp. NPDC048998]|uniref:DNA glycosylase AlkZ-like family protein n=1 Tax=Dactylosporangium sp. NPDC048998 TaxID=3363976 RepID=UPI00371FF64E